MKSAFQMTILYTAKKCVFSNVIHHSNVSAIPLHLPSSSAPTNTARYTTKCAVHSSYHSLPRL